MNVRSGLAIGSRVVASLAVARPGSRVSGRAEWRPEQTHVVSLEAGGDLGGIGGAGARQRAEFLVEPMSATRRVHDDDLSRLVGEVDERVWEA